MNVSININSPMTVSHTLSGREDMRLVVEEGTVDINMNGLSAAQATEVIIRLRGMPGIPELNTESVPLTALLSAFPRKLDL